MDGDRGIGGQGDWEAGGDGEAEGENCRVGIAHAIPFDSLSLCLIHPSTHPPIHFLFPSFKKNLQ